MSSKDDLETFVAAWSSVGLDCVLKPMHQKLFDSLVLRPNGQASRVIGACFEKLFSNLAGSRTVKRFASAPSVFPTEVKLTTPAAVRALENRTLTRIAPACHHRCSLHRENV